MTQCKQSRKQCIAINLIKVNNKNINNVKNINEEDNVNSVTRWMKHGKQGKHYVKNS